MSSFLSKKSRVFLKLGSFLVAGLALSLSACQNSVLFSTFSLTAVANTAPIAATTRFSPDGNRILVIADASPDPVPVANRGIVQVFDIVTGNLAAVLQDHGQPEIAWTAEFSPNGDRIVTTGPHRLMVWDSQTGHPLTHVGPPDSSSGYFFRSAVFLPDGKHVAAFQIALGEVEIWNIETGAPDLWVSKKVGANYPNLVISQDGTKLIVFEPDPIGGEFFIISSRFQAVVDILDVQMGTIIFSHHLNKVTSPASSNLTELYAGTRGVSPLGHYAAVHYLIQTLDPNDRTRILSRKKIIRVWDTVTGTVLYEIPADIFIERIEFSADEQFFMIQKITQEGIGSVDLIETRSGQVISSFSGKDGRSAFGRVCANRTFINTNDSYYEQAFLWNFLSQKKIGRLHFADPGFYFTYDAGAHRQNFMGTMFCSLDGSRAFAWISFSTDENAVADSNLNTTKGITWDLQGL